MKKPSFNGIPQIRKQLSKGFTLMETVIAIGVLAVLLTGFIAVFTPAAQGIRRSISSQQADRLATVLELELVTPRSGQAPATNQSVPATAITGFQKAFTWIREGNTPANAIFVYQYRGNPAALRGDGTPTPLPAITGQPGKNYVVFSMARRASEVFFQDDLKAIEGAIFYVKPTQLIYDSTGMILNPDNNIKNPTPLPVRVPPYPPVPLVAQDYSEAVIAFSAEFYSVPSKSAAYIQGPQFATRFTTAKRPVFTRNLAVRR